MLQPWRSAGLAVALVASFAVPAFMTASATGFLESASDTITRQLIEDQPADLDVAVVTTGMLDQTNVDELDERMRDQLGRNPILAEPRRLVSFGGGDLGLQIPSAGADEPATPIIGSRGRFLADDDAIAALPVLDGDQAVDGIWVSERRAERLDLTVGMLVAVNNSDPVPIAGIFANLWEVERDPYWDALPPVFVPTYSRVFNGPTFEIMVVPESLAYEFGVVGTVRWDADAVGEINGLDELRSYVARLRATERSFTEVPSMSDAVAAFSGDGGPVPELVTGADDLQRDAERIVDELDQPIATAAIGGILLGLVVTAAGAAFAVRQRRVEVRLQRADGDPAWRFAARALVQYLPPAALGAAVGAGVGWVWFSIPAGDGTTAFEIGPILRTAILGLVVAAAVTALAASRALTTRSASLGSLSPAWILPVVGIAIAAWVQVGSRGEAAEIDPLVVGFPLIGLIAGVSLAVLAARWCMRRMHRSGGSLPPALFLAWRRITAAESGAVLLAGAMGIALGLVVFSSTLASSLEVATDAKVTTVVGGRTQAQLRQAYDGPLPENTTLIRLQTSPLTIGEGSVEVVAIDPATYSDGVSWHASFGGSADEIIAAVQQPADGDIAAVAVGERPVPQDGGFGRSSVIPYRVVDRVQAVPLASATHPTLVISAEQILNEARLDHDAARPPDTDPDEWAQSFRSPLDRYRQMLVSQQSEAELTEFLEANDLQVRSMTTSADQRELVGTRAARWTFRYLGVLAVIAAIAAAGTLLFYLSEQRASRQLSTVMAERMGLRPTTSSVAAVAEVLGLVIVAYSAGATTGVLLAARLFDQFEPAPRVPPDVGLGPPWSTLGTLAAGAVALVIVASLLDHFIAGRRSYGEVLRDG